MNPPHSICSQSVRMPDHLCGWSALNQECVRVYTLIGVLVCLWVDLKFAIHSLKKPVSSNDTLSLQSNNLYLYQQSVTFYNKI